MNILAFASRVGALEPDRCFRVLSAKWLAHHLQADSTVASSSRLDKIFLSFCYAAILLCQGLEGSVVSETVSLMPSSDLMAWQAIALQVLVADELLFPSSVVKFGYMSFIVR